MLKGRNERSLHRLLNIRTCTYSRLTLIIYVSYLGHCFRHASWRDNRSADLDLLIVLDDLKIWMLSVGIMYLYSFREACKSLLCVIKGQFIGSTTFDRTTFTLLQPHIHFRVGCLTERKIEPEIRRGKPKLTCFTRQLVTYSNCVIKRMSSGNSCWLSIIERQILGQTFERAHELKNSLNWTLISYFNKCHDCFLSRFIVFILIICYWTSMAILS